MTDRISKWLQKHINMKSDEEFVIFLVWAIFSAVFFFSLMQLS